MHCREWTINHRVELAKGKCARSVKKCKTLKYGQYITIDKVSISEGNVSFIYVTNKKICTIQDFDGIRETFNDYLETHPDSFLNNEYKIEIQINGTKSGGPCI